FEEPMTGNQYTDTGDANVAHDLVNNAGEAEVDFIATATELGFDASYAPYDVPGVGLTDGDFVGTTDFMPGGGVPYTDGVQGYQISDVDGNYIRTFDAVDLTNTTATTLSIDYFIAETGYEGDGTVNESGSDRIRIYVKDLTNSTEIDILDTTGSDINDLMIEGSWITGTAALVPNTTVQLVIEVRTNSGAEAVFFDNMFINGEVLGVATNNALSFSVSPNPATSNVFINSSVNGEMNVAVYSILGNKVMNTVTNGNLDISSLKSGVYLVQITQGSATATQKLVVK
ncbi:MAG: T9SS type A sorting domain-containing protein, partial [Flavobacteriaceae bacterium]|nr:T9SS type A sorting domain-containing protein [Flavobacteriaceae bacterium]